MKKSQIFIYALVIGVVYALFFGYEISKPNSGEEWGAVALPYVFIGIIVIPLVFGIVLSLVAKQKKLGEFAVAFGISFVTILILLLLVGAWHRTEIRKQYPVTTTPTIRLDSPSRKMPLPN